MITREDNDAKKWDKCETYLRLLDNGLERYLFFNSPVSYAEILQGFQQGGAYADVEFL